MAFIGGDELTEPLFGLLPQARGVEHVPEDPARLDINGFVDGWCLCRVPRGLGGSDFSHIPDSRRRQTVLSTRRSFYDVVVDPHAVDQPVGPAIAASAASASGAAAPAVAGPPVGARERILATSYELFARRGIKDVGGDELIARSGVAKATFYKHFRSKDELALAYLDRWYEARSAAVDAAVARRGDVGDAALLAIFDVFNDWFRQGAAEVSSFLHVMMEMGPDHPLGRASIDYLARTRSQMAALATAAGLRDPEDFAWSCHILLKGAIVAAAEGDGHAAERARKMAALLIDLHRAPGSPTL